MNYLLRFLTLIGLAIVLAGCEQFQRRPKPPESSAKAILIPVTHTNAVITEPATNLVAIGYLPSGSPASSVVMLERIAPREAVKGRTFEYTLVVSNLTDLTLKNVRLLDSVSSNFTMTEATLVASSYTNGRAIWNFGTLEPHQSTNILVTGTPGEDGFIQSEASVAYSAVLTQSVPVLKPGIAMSMSQPSDILFCDPLPITFTIKNTGEVPLTSIYLYDEFPPSITSSGTNKLYLAVGDLPVGGSRDVKVIAQAGNTGRFINSAQVYADQNTSARDTAATSVHQATLTIACKATPQQYTGRKIETAFTLYNTGDVAASNVVVVLPIPEGLTLRMFASNGVASSSNLIWNLESLEPETPATLCADFQSANAGTFEFKPKVSALCADAVESSITSKVVGLAAILVEKSDSADPIPLNGTTVYTVKITNQGNAEDKNLEVKLILPEEMKFVSSSAGTVTGQTVTFPKIVLFPAHADISYTVTAQGVKAGEGHAKIVVTSEGLLSPINTEESTTVY